MSLRLAHHIATHKLLQAQSESSFTKAYHLVKQPTRWAGMKKWYEPADDEGQRLPDEVVVLQVTGVEVLQEVITPLSELLDATATLDSGNQSARADLVIDGKVVVPDLPVSTLLFLEKKAVDLRTFLDSLPTLDQAEVWEPVDGRSWKTAPLKKVRTDKAPTRFEKSPATDKHPAQVEILYLDKVVGEWATVKFSGAIPVQTKRELLAKLTKFQLAVKAAREQANSTPVGSVKIGAAIFAALGWDLEAAATSTAAA